MEEQNNSDEMQEFHPKGTIAVLVLYILTIIVLWGSVYVILLSRGVTIR